MRYNTNQLFLKQFLGWELLRNFKWMEACGIGSIALIFAIRFLLSLQHVKSGLYAIAFLLLPWYGNILICDK